MGPAAPLLSLLIGAWGAGIPRSAAPVSAGAVDSPATAPTVEAPVGGTYPWIPDRGDGSYRNPVVLADYSDPDVIRVGDLYYLVASSFQVTPALPILRSPDLVNWTIVGHALENLPYPRFAAVEPGGGVWAPAWRARAGRIYLYFPMPDDGIFLLTAASPAGPWSPPRLVVAGKGLIDPCPFWDDDGRAFLVHAFAKSRSGIKSKLRLVPMAPDGNALLGDGEIVFDGATSRPEQPTIEGPKLYKRHGWYYILAPAGGVPAGWQVALRARDIHGPYQARVVLQQGATPVNGPHQGALVDTPDGRQWWFVHFQDQGVYGRVVHLNPVTWVDDWPLMGVAGTAAAAARDAPALAAASNASDVRQPVLGHEKPAVGVTAAASLPAMPQTSDDFRTSPLGPQWQWNANHEDTWYSLTARPSWLRLYAVPLSRTGAGAIADLALAPNLLLQKLPARSFAVETTVDPADLGGAARAGLIVVGKTAAALEVSPLPPGSGVRVRTRVALILDGKDVASADLAPSSATVRLRVDVADGGLCRFSYGPAAVAAGLAPIGPAYQAQPGRWIGARVGLFAVTTAGASRGPPPAGGHADFGPVRFLPPGSSPSPRSSPSSPPAR